MLSGETMSHVRSSSIPQSTHVNVEFIAARSNSVEMAERVTRPVIRLLLNLLMLVITNGGAVIFWWRGLWPLTIVCWIVGGHFMHTIALSFHDAAHGTLHPRRAVNEFVGFLYGTLILVPMTVYRCVHALHHSQLASVRDPELYPFVVPETSRAFRLVCAATEIVLGYFYTPLLFLRAVCCDRKLTRSKLRRIQLEYCLILCLLIGFFTIIYYMKYWQYYLVGILIPAMVGGAYQTLNKYTEHLGLHGTTVLESTRSILPRDHWNKAISSLLEHVDHHGTHHLRCGLPYLDLPRASEEVYQGRQDGLPLFASYPAALWDMLKTLHDPKAGPQWLPSKLDSDLHRARFTDLVWTNHRGQTRMAR